MPKVEQQKTYSVFDPSVQAFRSISLADAKLYVETAEKIKAELIEDGELPASQEGAQQ